MYLQPYTAYPVWIEGTKVYQRVIGFPWIMEVEGELHKKYEPQYKTKYPFFGLFGKPKQVEINKPTGGELYQSGGILFYVDQNFDWRKITPACKPHFKVYKKGVGDNAKKTS